jgi:hypothetical protein
MISNLEELQELRLRFDNAVTVEAVLEFWHDVETIACTHNLPGEVYDLLIDAVRSLKELTADDPKRGKAVILDYILPLLEKDIDLSLESHTALSVCRKQLIDWLHQYAEADYLHIRDQVLDKLHLSLKSAFPKSACWTVSSIGFRRKDIVDALCEVVALYDDETGDIALSTLTMLGIPSESRSRILSTLHQRALRRCNMPLIFALRRLADPASLEVVRDYWLQPGNVRLSEWELSHAAYIFTDVADALPDDVQLQDRVWKIVSDLCDRYPDIFESHIRLHSDFVPKCNNTSVVSDMLKRLDGLSEKSDRSAHGRYLLYLRLAACVRPRQLLGWANASGVVALDLLRRDACQDSSMPGSLLTPAGHRKDAAWTTLLCLGYPGVVNWFEESVSKETNPYMRQKISQLLACLRFDPLPPIIHKLVTEPYDYRANTPSGEFAMRLGAIQVARSSASQEAFHALSVFGLTHDGQALQDSADALAEIALFLTRAGNTSVVDVLVETAVRSSSEHHRVAAAAALGAIAAEDLLLVTYAPRLSELLFDADRNDFERSLFVSILGYLKGIELSTEVLQQLQTWALDRNDWLSVRSMEALARQDQLLSQHDILINKLGLEQRDGRWAPGSTPSRFRWTPLIVSLLYVQHADIFTPAIVALLHTQGWSGAVQIIRTLQSFHGSSEEPVLPRDIERAFIERVYQQQVSPVAELELFDVLMQLMPDALGLEHWDHVWNDWLPDARVALANALGEAKYSEPSAQNHAVSLLLNLTRDGQYAIRRAAYRGLARQSAESLHALCATGSDETSAIALRQRAAEAWGWLVLNEEQSDIIRELYQKLSVDPEKSVREAIERVRQERRERVWAAEYLERVRAVAMNGATNDDIMKTWCYGHALTQVGDDATERVLIQDLQTRKLPPHIRYWLQQIIKGISERWRKVTQKWPEPWLAMEGIIEEGKGEIEVSGGQELQVNYTLWQKPAATPSQKHAWGGTVWPVDFFGSRNLDDFVLYLEDGRQLTALVTRISGLLITFIGQEYYPEKN